MPEKKSLKTIIAQGYTGYKNKSMDKQRSLSMPILPSTTYLQDDGNSASYLYARVAHPAAQQIESFFSSIEQGKEALVFNSGMAAMTAFFSAFAKNSHIIVQQSCYFVTKEWFENFADYHNFTVDFLDLHDHTKLEKIIQNNNTALIWLETPSNPYWDIMDISKICKIAHHYNCKVAVDSTAATPILTKPLTLGADYVFHSASKALCGHGDILAGALVIRQKCDLWDKIILNRRLQGSILSAFDCWLLMRSMRTLYLRITHSCETALLLATWLENHPQVSHVYYPGLKSYSRHKLAQLQMQNGYGFTFSFVFNSSYKSPEKFVHKTKVFNQATSYGEIDSRIELRNIIQNNLNENLIRVSIGLESFEDLKNDLAQAF